MTQLLLAIAGYAVFTTVLNVIERIQDRRRSRSAQLRLDPTPTTRAAAQVSPGSTDA